MKKYLIIVIAMLCGTSMAAQASDVSSYIVRTKDRVAVRSALAAMQVSKSFTLLPESFAAAKRSKEMIQASAALLRDLDNTMVVRFQSRTEADKVIAALRANPDVVSVEPNYKLKIDQIKASEITKDDQWALKAVGAAEAWAKAKGKGVTVGIVDTGIDFYHPALAPALHINAAEDINQNGKFDPWPNTESRNGVFGDFDGIDNDGNGFDDDVIGYDFIDQYAFNFGDYSSPDPIPLDENGHGTAVGGIIAAREVNAKGIIGLAPESKLLIARSFDLNGEGESSNIAAGIVYCALSGARVINCSFGEETDSKIVHDAVKFARSMGCLVVCSAGNNGSDIPHFPSDYEEVISIGSSNSTGQKDGSSNFGSRLALLAPGNGVLTTALGGEYRKASGTSMSTPHVAATAALLLALDATLTPADLSGIVSLTARNVDLSGWTYENGFGVLSAADAVNHAGRTNLALHSPLQGNYYDRNGSAIPVVATGITPLFDYMEIMIGNGDVPDEWHVVGNRITNQPKNDTVALINPSDYSNGGYSVRMVIYLKNNKTVEKRALIVLDSFAAGFSMDSVMATAALKDNAYMMLLTARTSSPSTMSVKYAPKSNPLDQRSVTEWDYITRYHLLSVPANDLRPGEEYSAQISCKRTDGAILTDTISFTLPKDPLPTSGFDMMTAHFPASYLMNDAADLYSDGLASFVTNDIAWSKSYSYSFEKDSVVLVDSLSTPWVPVGYGDSNGDGIPEVFTKSRWRSILYQAKAKGESPFSSIPFADTTSNNLWAAGMLDFDGDGLKDLIAYSDSAFHVFHFKNGKYSLLAQTNVEKRFKALSTYPSFAAGNFDGSGRPQISFYNKRGQLIICKYENGAFSTIFIDSANTSESTRYLCSADVDGDGSSELLAAGVSSKIFYGYDQLKNEIRDYRLFKYNKDESRFEIIWNQIVHGIREGRTSSGVDYRNGIAAGRVDGDTCETLILTPFGNTYFFKWDMARRAIVPTWYLPASFSNSAIVYDFDRDGKNEICVSTGEFANFFKYDYGFSGPQSPTELYVYSESDTSAVLRWRASDKAKSYKIMLGRVNGSVIEFDQVAIKTDTTHRFNGLNRHSWYYFTVIAHNSDLADQDSKHSDIVSVFTHNPFAPNSIQSNGTRSIEIGYSGPITNRVIEPSIFSIAPDAPGEKIYPQTVNRLCDTMVLATFENDILPGNYTLYYGSFPDYFNTPTGSGQLQFVFSPDTVAAEMYLANLKLINKYTLELGFTEVPAAGALDKENYTISPTGEVLSVEVSNNEKGITVRLDPNSNIGPHGITYSITVKNVISSVGHPITKGAGNTMSFVLNESGFSNAFVAPNPIRYSENPTIRFAGLPTNSTIEIYSLANKFLRSLRETDNNGGVEWDGLDENGNRLETGIYLYRIRQANPDGSFSDSELKKFAVVK